MRCLPSMINKQHIYVTTCSVSISMLFGKVKHNFPINLPFFVVCHKNGEQTLLCNIIMPCQHSTNPPPHYRAAGLDTINQDVVPFHI